MCWLCWHVFCIQPIKWTENYMVSITEATIMAAITSSPWAPFSRRWTPPAACIGPVERVLCRNTFLLPRFWFEQSWQPSRNRAIWCNDVHVIQVVSTCRYQTIQTITYVLATPWGPQLLRSNHDPPEAEEAERKRVVNAWMVKHLAIEFQRSQESSI